MFTPHHMSHVICHKSCVTCHMSHVLFHLFLLQSGEASWCRVCYQQGRPCLVLTLAAIFYTAITTDLQIKLIDSISIDRWLTGLNNGEEFFFKLNLFWGGGAPFYFFILNCFLYIHFSLKRAVIVYYNGPFSTSGLY